MGTPHEPPRVVDLQARLLNLTLRDERRLGRRLDGVRRVRDPRKRQAALDELATAIDAAETRAQRRRASVPGITYPPELPVSQHRDEIRAAIRDHLVVVVAGETGSGKTTQLPKLCLELGRGVRGQIGHTQPRRLAARTVAERIAEELQTPLGGPIGYTVRFTDQASDNTLVKVMTDGILLAELQRDRDLLAYDTLIVDEAHERSLNIDFILGYLAQLLPRRPDLKVVITSATIDSQRFAAHFGDAPVIEVSGRTYPVEVRYRPIVEDADDADRDQTQAICDAAEELRGEGPGDVLVFLSGEREIRDTADALRRMHLPDTEILPLYARLSAAEQHRVFEAHRGRRIVLATNVAETSLTVPGVRYVVDPGTARISRYSNRLKVQRLPIEAISQASANQRAGRCGRVADGICIRLYAEDDFLARPEFTEPEILRTNLASVILAMTALGLGDVAAFPFVDAPDHRNVRDGIALLHELGAIDPAERDPRKRLTPLGRKLVQVPVDPRLARMVLEADANGCAREVMVIVAALSIQDPRERPADRQQAADDAHRRFADENSDFLSYLRLWEHVQDQQQALSSSAFRRMCKVEFLHYLRIREWQDLVAQLHQVAKSMGISTAGSPPDADRVHLSLLAGLLSHIGLRDIRTRDYLGARGARFAVFPGSALARKPPSWVMAGELVETSRLWGRVVARIEPEWAERLAQHLVKRSYSEPHWERKRGAVVAYEKVTLYGVPLVAARKVAYGRIDPQLSRELFIRHALVEGDWQTHHRFFHDNRRLLAEVEDLEHRVRRRDILVDDETLFDFYDQRLPSEVVSAAHFDSWWKQARRSRPDLLTFSPEMLVSEDASRVSPGDYPDSWHLGELALRVSYQFEPGTDADGVTVHVPLPVLNQLSADGFDWQVPGLRLELVTALIRSLPKAVRRNFVPAPDHAAAVLRRLDPGAEPLLDALARELRALTGTSVSREDWQWDRVPSHLRVTYRVEDEQGQTLAAGKDLAVLRRQLAAEMQSVLSAAASSLEQQGLRNWSIGALPHVVDQYDGGHPVRGYPALVDEEDSVAVRVLGSEADQRTAMWRGTRRLLMLNVPAPARSAQGALSGSTKLALASSPYGSVSALLDDCTICALDALIAAGGGPVRDAEGFGVLLDAVRQRLPAAVLDVVTVVERILTAARSVEAGLKATTSLAVLPTLTDVRAQVSALIYPGFVSATGARRLPDLVRYLRAVERRLETLHNSPVRDRERQARVAHVQQAYEELVSALPPERRAEEAVLELRWLIEELRVSLFAQTLGTPVPVSDKRILRAIDQLAP